MGDLQQWHDWVNTGALAAFAVFVCWMASRLLTHGGKKALEIGERYVTSTEELHTTLKDAEVARNKLCGQHADGIDNLATVVASQNANTDKMCEAISELSGQLASRPCMIGKEPNP